MRVLQDSDTHEPVLMHSNHVHRISIVKPRETALLHNTAYILEYHKYNSYHLTVHYCYTPKKLFYNFKFCKYSMKPTCSHKMQEPMRF